MWSRALQHVELATKAPDRVRRSRLGQAVPEVAVQHDTPDTCEEQQNHDGQRSLDLPFRVGDRNSGQARTGGWWRRCAASRGYCLLRPQTRPSSQAASTVATNANSG